MYAICSYKSGDLLEDPASDGENGSGIKLNRGLTVQEADEYNKLKNVR